MRGFYLNHDIQVYIDPCGNIVEMAEEIYLSRIIWMDIRPSQPFIDRVNGAIHIGFGGLINTLGEVTYLLVKCQDIADVMAAVYQHTTGNIYWEDGIVWYPTTASDFMNITVM